MTQNLYNDECEYYLHFNFQAILKVGEQMRREGTGFRIPTPKDFAYLAGLGARWVNYDESNFAESGCIFGKKAHEVRTDGEFNSKNCVFLPAFGFYKYDSDEFIGQDFAAYYWSSWLYLHSDSAYILYVREKNIFNTIHFNKKHGLPVRCVRDLI
jgi:uncharacterized protein (TIGR02145 family)